MLGQNKCRTDVYAGMGNCLGRVWEKCAFAAILCALLFATGCGDNDKGNTPAPDENVCTKDSTKCGDGADANKLYTCTEAAKYDDGVDCAANNSHKVCGGDDVKSCICDAANGYVENAGACVCGKIGDIEYIERNGSCEIKEICDDQIQIYNETNNDCDCDTTKAVINAQGQCEKIAVCDKDGQLYVANTNSCACDAENHWTTDADGCKCDDEHRVNSGGTCVCDADNNWIESDGSCIKCDYRFNGQCTTLQGTVTFGNYPQSSDTPEPIEWIVLDAKDGKLLLLSKYVIDVNVYDKSHKTQSDETVVLYPTWAESDIRSWLNDSSKSGFMSAAFSGEEMKVIEEVTNSTSDYGDIDGGEDSKDKVFLLDHADAANTDYFKDAGARIAMATAYVVSKEACVSTAGASGCTIETVETCPHVSCSAEWWLRSPGYRKTTAAVIAAYFNEANPDGIFNWSTVNMGNVGVRPALWVKY